MLKTEMLKTGLRQNLLRSRMALSPKLYQEYSDRLCLHLQNFFLNNLAPGQTVLAYQPHRQEPDLRQLFRQLNYQWGLPRCLPQRQLAWHLWQPGEPLVNNSYGLAEPLAIAPPIDPVSIAAGVSGAIGALLIPMVGFDAQGYRLGYGGGYFDRLLANPDWQQVLTIGIAFNLALVPKIPIDPWDLPLHRIFTESGMVVDLV
jgi:5-formyltetrahydrofolate cyclo-ligase